MKQRTVIITGSNSGIGKAAAIRFAEEGHSVIMACRNRGKVSRFLQRLKNSPAMIVYTSKKWI